MSWINTGVCENLFLVSLDLVSLRFHFWFCCLSVFLQNYFWKKLSYILGTNPSNGA